MLLFDDSIHVLSLADPEISVTRKRRQLVRSNTLKPISRIDAIARNPSIAKAVDVVDRYTAWIEPYAVLILVNFHEWFMATLFAYHNLLLFCCASGPALLLGIICVCTRWPDCLFSCIFCSFIYGLSSSWPSIHSA